MDVPPPPAAAVVLEVDVGGLLAGAGLCKSIVADVGTNMY